MASDDDDAVGGGRWRYQAGGGAAILAFVLVVAAVFLYPGGTELPGSNVAGFAWGENYLSDLGRWVTPTGPLNQTGAVLFNAALLLTAAAGVLLFQGWLRPPEPKKKPDDEDEEDEEERGPDMSGTLQLSALAGVVGCLALVALVLFPASPRTMEIHGVMLLVGTIAFGFAAAAHAYAMSQTEGMTVWAAPGALFVVAALAYLATGVWPQARETAAGPMAAGFAVWGQFLAAGAGIAWLASACAQALFASAEEADDEDEKYPTLRGRR